MALFDTALCCAPVVRRVAHARRAAGAAPAVLLESAWQPCCAHNYSHQESHMFQLFGFGGARCPRCEHKNGAAAGYCGQCGLSLGAPDSDTVLHANQWRLAEDQLALFFGVRELSSLFGATAKRVQVPFESRAWIVQADAFTLIPAGDYDSTAFFARLPALLPARPAEVLIARADSLSLEFDLPSLSSTELLAIAATFRIDVTLGQPDA